MIAIVVDLHPLLRCAPFPVVKFKDEDTTLHSTPGAFFGVLIPKESTTVLEGLLLRMARAFTHFVSAKEVSLDEDNFHYKECLLSVSIPTRREKSWRKCLDIVEAIRSRTEWRGHEIWIDREVFGEGCIRTDWKDHWDSALNASQRGLIFVGEDGIAGSKSLEWEFDRMNDELSKENMIYVVLSGAMHDLSLAFINTSCQGSTILDTNICTTEQIADYIAQLPWDKTRGKNSSSCRFVFDTAETGTLYSRTTLDTITWPRSPLVYSLNGILTATECEKLVSQVSKLEFAQAPVCACDKAAVNSSLRSHKRFAVDDPELAGLLFERLHTSLPARMRDGSRLVRLNSRIRWLKYDVGDYVKVHRDGAHVDKDGTRSALSLLIYLNTLGSSSGGATRFYPSWTSVDQGELYYEVEPVAGRVCVMQQDALHESTECLEGTKICLRTDVMYEMRLMQDSSSMAD